jgi:hypothetical protein
MRVLRRPLLLVAAAVAAWCALVIPGPAQHGSQTTADEPHYLLSALSLAEDRSLDVSDELRAERFRAFHRLDLPRQADTTASGRQVVPHDPGLPLLLAFPMALGGWVAAKAALAALAGALAAAMVWVAVRRFAVDLRVAVLSVAAFALAAPLAVYGTQVYPELPAALAVTAAIAALTGPLGRRGLVLLGVALLALPWLSVKYVPTTAVLALVGAARLGALGRRRDLLVLGAALALAGGLYVAAHEAWYGGLTPYAAGYHFRTGELSVIGTHPNYPGRSIRLAGLLLDRDFGLAAWQPAYLLAVPALAALVRRRPAGWVALGAPIAAGWLTATFVALTMHGWWFPGRQVVHVLPACILAVAWLAQRSARVRALLVAAAALGASVYAWLVISATFGDATVVTDFGISHPARWLARVVLPDYRRLGALDWTLHACWLTVLAALAVAAWRTAGSEPGARRRVRQAPPPDTIPPRPSEVLL